MCEYRIKKVSKYCEYKKRVQEFYSVEYRFLGLIWININIWDLFCDHYIYRTEKAARNRIEAHKLTKICKVETIEVNKNE